MVVVDITFSYQAGCIGGGDRVRDGGADEGMAAIWWLLLDDGRCRSCPLLFYFSFRRDVRDPGMNEWLRR